jgi:molybdate transport system ATP-binding protein
MNNIGLYLSNASNKQFIISEIFANRLLRKYIDLSALQGALHSSITVNRFVDEELQHDRFVITTPENPSLGSMSSGQQKKALLTYLISQKPQYLVLDDVYSNMDIETQQTLKTTLAGLAGQTRMIQIFFRKQDLLPVIDTVLTVDGNNTIVQMEAACDFIVSQAAEKRIQQQFRFPTEYDENHTNIDPLVQLNSVSVWYGEKAVLNKVNWTIRKGEFWQLMGPNGSGKSTLLSMIIGDNPRGYGQNMILFGKKKGTGETIWDIKRQIGYFTPAMMNRFTRNDTVENMIISGMLDSVGLYIHPTDLQKDIAQKWLKMLGINYPNKLFQSLSPGQQRMIMVVRAMVKHPSLLILDEPTIELDDTNSRLFIELIHAIAAEKKIAIVYVSHREEPDLQPDFIFELIPSDKGYTGVIKK